MKRPTETIIDRGQGQAIPETAIDRQRRNNPARFEREAEKKREKRKQKKTHEDDLP